MALNRQPAIPVRLLVALLVPLGLASGHDVITTKLTWAKEISRIVLKRCGGCHRPEGKAFPLLKYEEARPWAKAIQEEVLRRRMPPSNVIQGFGNLRHDRGLSEEEIHLLADWVEGGAPEGDANLLPAGAKPPAEPEPMKGARRPFRGEWKAQSAVELLGVELEPMPAGRSFKLVAEYPDGSRAPLLWVYDYSPRAAQNFEFAGAVRLPAGAKVKAYPAEGVALKLVTGLRPRR